MIRNNGGWLIQITVKKVLMWAAGVAFVLISSIWFLWSVALTQQIRSVREELIVAMTESLKRSMVDNFEQCHANLLRLEGCQALLAREKATVDDLTKMLQKKDPDEVFQQKEEKDAKEVKKSAKKVARHR